MLLSDEPKRLSTDIDIIVKPGTDISMFIERAAEIFPFIKCIEQTRKTARDIEKKHFKFFYESPISGGSLHIILDVVFEENNYSNVMKKELTSRLLDTEPPATYITVPTVDCILGDKLTAFAPHTIGIPFGIGKEMEVIKQLYDVATLIDRINDFSAVKDTYICFAEKEIRYRELNISYKETLIDSFNTAIAIIDKGKLFPQDHRHLLDGVRRIRGHIFDNYTTLTAEDQSCRVAYLVANILADKEEFVRIENTTPYQERMITDPVFARLNYVRKTNIIGFAHLYEAIRLFNNLPNDKKRCR